MAKPSDSHDKPGVNESLYASMSERLSRRLFDEVVAAKSLHPQMSRAQGFAFVIATLVYLIVFLICLLGIVWLIYGFSNFIFWIGAAICFALTWFLAPRLPRAEGAILSRNDYPALYRVFDRVASALNAQPVDGIILNEDYNAAYSQIG